MTSLIVGVLLIGVQPETPVQPVAMVLASKGQVTIVRGPKERSLTEMDLLQPGDTVRVGNGGSAKLVILNDGHREEIVAGVEVKLTADGCQPATDVKREASKLSQVQLTNLRKMAQSQRGGVVVIRSGNAPPVAAVKRSPLNGTTVLTLRPKFQWANLPDQQGYRIELFGVQTGKPDRLIWKVEQQESDIEYPEKITPLSPGAKYRWQVTALLGGDQEQVVVNARFVAPDEETIAQVKNLIAMAQSDDPAEWLLAGTTMESMGAYESALPLFERLAQKFPNSGRYHEVLAEYYHRAGEADKSAAAAAKAKKLLMNE